MIKGNFLRNIKTRAICFGMAIVLGFSAAGVHSVYADTNEAAEKSESTFYVLPGIEIPGIKSEYHSFAVIDARSGELIMGDRQDEPVYPASTTKLATALVIAERLKLKKVVTVKKDIFRYIPGDLSKFGIKTGEKYTVETLLNMALVSSAGDAAICAAIEACGSMEGFIEAVNDKVEELGLKNTHFDNPSGLDIGNDYIDNYSSAYDIAMITRAAMANKTIRAIVEKPSYEVRQYKGTKSTKIKSTNKFYTDIEYDNELFTVIGSKTGSTKAAGHVFTATATDAYGREVICTFMGKGAMSDTFKDIASILKCVFTAIKNYEYQSSCGKRVIAVENDRLDFTLDYGRKAKITHEVYDSRTKLSLNDKVTGKITYSSSNPEIVYVNQKGVITVLKEGNAVITLEIPADGLYKRSVAFVSVSIAEK